MLTFRYIGEVFRKICERLRQEKLEHTGFASFIKSWLYWGIVKLSVTSFLSYYAA